MSDNPLIDVNNLVRYYGDTCAVDNISFELHAGDILGFLGPNGAGKSTTMQVLSGNLAPSVGEVRINGIDLLDKPSRAKSQIGYLPEQPPLYPEMTVDEYLLYCAKLRRIPKGEIAAAVSLAKQRCGLESVHRRLIANLSKGFQQRVGIAQAIVHSPRVIILDEPTVGLDPIQIREIRDLIVELGKTHGIILSTHILPEVQAVCNRVQIIHQGRLVYSAGVEEFAADGEGGSYHVVMQDPPPLERIAMDSLVEKVEPLDAHSFLITTNGTADELAGMIVYKGWRLSRFAPQVQNLEQIFIDLTLGDEPAAQAADRDEQPEAAA